MKKIGIIGAGGYAQVIAEMLGSSNEWKVIGFFDDFREVGTPVLNQLSVLGTISTLKTTDFELDGFVIGIGDNQTRNQIAVEYAHLRFNSFIHSKAVVATGTQIGAGTVVLAGAVINVNATVDQHCIIDSNSVVDHDCKIGSFVHLAIGTLVGSNSSVSAGTKTDIGQIIPTFSEL